MKVLITAKINQEDGGVFYKQNEVYEVCDTLLGNSYYRTIEGGGPIDHRHLEILLPLSEIVKAHEEGKKIELWEGGQWNSISGINHFSLKKIYRIAPEPKIKYVEFTTDDFEELADKWIENSSGKYKVIAVNQLTVQAGNLQIPYKALVATFNFYDTKKPVGKEATENEGS